jgi:hypothetical protein
LSSLAMIFFNSPILPSAELSVIRLLFANKNAIAGPPIGQTKILALYNAEALLLAVTVKVLRLDVGKLKHLVPRR